jgi:hypothetical protein
MTRPFGFMKGMIATASLFPILLSAFVFTGIAAGNGMATTAYAAMMDNNGNGTMMQGNSTTTMNTDSMMMTTKNMSGYHAVKGQISNVQLDSAGNPAWIQSGIWVTRVSIGNNNNNLESVQLIARFTMVKPDGTAMHTHMIYGFKPTQFMMEQNGTVAVLEGMATVTMNTGPVSDVPITIKVFNESVIAFWIGPDKVDGHFGSNPIYGILTMGSKSMMMEMDSMMGDGNMMGSMNGSENMSTSMMEQNLAKTNIPVSIPLTRGYENGSEIFYISTEASDKDLASLMTNWTGARVTYAPSLANTPAGAFANIYAFKNGVKGTGPLGFQPNVADSQPGDLSYSPLWRIILVEWKDGVTATELKSEQAITSALGEGKLTIQPTTNIVNCPLIKWNGGSLMERADKNLNDKSPYGPGQVLNIDTANMTVTFVAHRGFAPSGSTIYYIATDASSLDVAKALGVTFVNKTGAITLSSASSDLYVFTNGIKGTGPMGYQASIAGSNVGEMQYSPMWRINAVTWKDSAQAKFLTTLTEIGAASSSGMLTTQVVGFVVNCPFVEVSSS